MKKFLQAMHFFNVKRFLLVLFALVLVSSVFLPKTFSVEGEIVKLKSLNVVAVEKPEESLQEIKKKTEEAEKKKAEEEKAKATVPKEAGVNCKNVSILSNPGASIVCFVVDIFTWFLGLIIKLLSLIIFILIEILLAFAKYNDFANATPVEMGWKIVRDICNMFFIVIILVSAFSTILQYHSDFHYTKVLPKLLLIAVLINFSRTLIQLLIDFSQVVMLTFVNAFYQAGAGNFVQALGLAQYLQVAESTTGGSGEVAATALNVLLSYMLAVILLIITVGVLVMFIGYIIARVVGLWIALIFSPIALFELAVPAKLQKGMSAFTTKYWSRLSTMLAGGPIIAFFLWLTLATVQETAGSGAFSQSLGLFGADKGNAGGFLSQIGNSQGIASFIIAIAMMLLGLDAAMEASQGMGSTMGKFAAAVKSRTEGAVRFAGRQFAKPVTVPAGWAKAGGIAAGGFGAGKLLKGIGKMQQSDNKGARILGAIGGAALASPLVKMKKIDNERVKKNLEAKEKDLKDLSYDEKLVMAKSNILPSITKAEKQKQANLYADLGSEKSQADQTKKKAKEHEDALLKANPKMDPMEAKREATARAMSDVAAATAGHLASAKEGYKKLGMSDKVGEMDKLLEANPSLIMNDEDREALIQKKNLDPKWKEGLSADALSRASTSAYLSDAFIRDDKGNFIGVDSAKKRAFLEKHEGTMLGDNVGALFNYVEGEAGAGKTVTRNDMNNLMLQKDVKSGKSFLYDPKSGRVRSAPEQKAVSDYRASVGRAKTAVSSLGGHEFSDPAVMSTITTTLPNMSMDEQMALAAQNGPEYRNAVVDSYGEAINMELGTLTTKADPVTGRVSDDDLKSILNHTTDIGSQVQGSGMSTPERMKIIAGFDGGMEVLSNRQNLDRLGKRNERMLQQVLTVGADLMIDIDKRLARKETLSDLEKAVKRVMDQAQKNLPRRKNSATGEEAAPAAYRKIIYRD